MRTSIATLAVLVVAFRGTLDAQSRPDTLQHAEGDSHPPKLAFGTSAGVMRFGDGGHERAISVAVSASLPHGFSVSVNPTYAWAQAAPTAAATTGTLSPAAPVQGVADLPVSIGYSHSLAGGWSPGFNVSLGATLPIGDTTTVGSGETSMGANLGMWMAPADGWSLSAGAGHSLANNFASGLGAIAPTTVSLGLGHDVGPASLNFGYSTEMGAMPTGTTHSQNFIGGVSTTVGGRWTLSADGSVGRADGTQSWALSLGIGTTIAEVGQVNPYAAAQRLASAFGKGRSFGNSRSTAAKAAMHKKGKKIN